MPRFIAGEKTVAQPKVQTEAAAPKINFRAIYVSSILAVTALFLVGVGVPMAIFLDSMSGGFALGAFTAFWGGPSFGVMVGSARVAAFEEKYGLD